MVAMVIFTAGEVLVFTMVDIHLDGMCEDQEKGTYFALSGVKSVGRIAGPSLGGFLLRYNEWWGNSLFYHFTSHFIGNPIVLL